MAKSAYAREWQEAGYMALSLDGEPPMYHTAGGGVTKLAKHFGVPWPDDKEARVWKERAAEKESHLRTCRDWDKLRRQRNALKAKLDAAEKVVRALCGFQGPHLTASDLRFLANRKNLIVNPEWACDLRATAVALEEYARLDRGEPEPPRCSECGQALPEEDKP